MYSIANRELSFSFFCRGVPQLLRYIFQPAFAAVILRNLGLLFGDPFKTQLAYLLFVIRYFVRGKQFLERDGSSSILESFVFQRNGLFLLFLPKIPIQDSPSKRNNVARVNK